MALPACGNGIGTLWLTSGLAHRPLRCRALMAKYNAFSLTAPFVKPSAVNRQYFYFTKKARW
jgi:hypothetical protein